MVARLSIYSNVDLDLADRLKAWMEGDGAGVFEKLPGYLGSMTLVDRENAQHRRDRLLRERRSAGGGRRGARGDLRRRARAAAGVASATH